MTDPTCPRCGKPMTDMAYVCRPCTEETAEDLAKAAAVAGDVTLTIAKLDQMDRDGGEQEPDPWEKNPGALFPNPLPINLGAAKAHDAAVGELSTWARHCVETRGIDITGSGHPLAILALWLRGQLDWLRHRQEADEALRAIQAAARAIVRIVDRDPVRGYVGKCTCGEPLRPMASARTVRCDCGLSWDVEECKAKLLDDLSDIWATADQSSHAMGALGIPVNASTIRTWAERGRLAPHPDSLPGRPRYRVGSVRELVEQMHAEQKERALRAAVKAAEMAERKRRKVSA